MKGTVFPRPSVKHPKTGAKRPVKGSTWTYVFSVPNGDRMRQISKGGFATRKACEAALAERLTEYGQGGEDRGEPSKMSLRSYLEGEWLPTLRELKPSTRKGYADLVAAYIAPHLGDVRLCDLTAGRIVSFYEKLRTSGRRRAPKSRPDDFSLSESTVHHVHVALSAALGHAAEIGLFGGRPNPMTRIPKKSRPKASSEHRPEMRLWSIDEVRAFLAAAAEDRLGMLFELALATGMRRGELVALRWEDVDFDRSIIAVRRNTVTVGYEAVEGTPKSKRARTIDIDADTVTALRAHRRRQLEERMAWGEAWQDHGLVFTREDGTPLHPQRATQLLRRISKRAGVSEVRLHDLRHTHATLGLAAGVPPKVMQERLGHSSIQITLDLYSHVVPGMQADAASKIGALLRGVG